MKDFVTILTSRGPLLTKTWTDAGLLNYDRAKFFSVEAAQVSKLSELAALLRTLEGEPTKCVIRGALIEHEGGTERDKTPRDLEHFVEVPHCWVVFDVDGFEPVLADPVLEPGEAVREFIQSQLPLEFARASHHWQLSSSAGAPGKSQYLKAHIAFWLSKPVLGSTLELWARYYKVPVDKTVFRTVQVIYTANPIMQGNVACPVAQRSGDWQGDVDEVDLVLPDMADATMALLNAPAGPGRHMADPSAKPGVIGAFCRLYPPERVIEEILPEVFSFEDDDRVRVTWHGGGGAPGGACVTDDAMHIYNSHDGDPFAGRAANMFDIVRHFKFGHLDGDDPSVYEFAGPQALPSFKAMKQWARALEDVSPEIQEREPVSPELPDQPSQAESDAVAAPTAGVPAVTAGARVEAHLRALLELEEDAALPFGPKAFDAQLHAIAWEPSRGQFKMMTPEGEVLQATREHFDVVMRERFPPIHDPVALEKLARAACTGKDLPATKRDAFLKQVLALPYGRLADLTVAHRQFTVIDAAVDIFATRGRLSLRDGRLSLLFPHEPLAEGPVDAALIADYRDHWSGLDDYLDLLVGARFATNRKAAHLWMHAPSDWGKNFLVEALAHHGLVFSTQASELEKALSGGPVGLTLEGMRRVWVLFVDEFKGVTRELKQLSSDLTFSPKNQARVSVPLYLKHFASAEVVPSLVSEDSGVEAQFANRFMYMRSLGTLTARPVFAAGKTPYFQTVCNFLGAEINRRVAEYRALGRAGAALKAERAITRLHAQYSLGDAVKGGAQTLEDKVPEIAAQFAEDMMVAYETAGARSGSLSDQKGRSDIFEHQGELWMRRAGAALDAWLEETYGRGEGAKIKYKRGDLLNALGDNRVIRLGARLVKARRLGLASDPLQVT